MGVVEVGTYKTVIFYDFFLHISSQLPWGGGGGGVDDTMIWQLNRSGVYAVHSFYYSLLEAPSLFSPWKSI